jgi:uncharacterized membrane protein YGL010W
MSTAAKPSLVADAAAERDWIGEYSQSHQNPVNRACHTVGIPMIAASLPLFAVAAVRGKGWKLPATLFTAGWAFQFIGHAFEGKPPEFFKDPRFLGVGLRWWFAKMRGNA